MNDKKAATLGEAMSAEKAEDRAKIAKAAADELRIEMEALAAKIRELILAQPPVELLGFLWGQYLMGMFHSENPSDRPIGKFQIVFEYVHAAWSAHEGEFQKVPLDETKTAELLEKCEKLQSLTMQYCMASSAFSENKDFGERSADIEFQAKSTWVLIRGHRYQVLEEEFFKFILAPHDTALRDAYGIGADEVAKGIQAAADAIRKGHSKALVTLQTRMEQTHELADREGISTEKAIEKLAADDATFKTEMSAAMKDLFFGGTCNLSRQTQLPVAFLDDLSFVPGSEKNFFAEGEFIGTPLRTLPARIRPLVKLADGSYGADGQFVRDSAYRAIQRGLIARLPAYREEWNSRQKKLTEGALTAILVDQFSGSQIHEGVFFKDVSTGQWSETDLVLSLDDALIVAEAKAGVMAMHSPATNYERHVRTIKSLVVDAYRQCSRFLDYLASAPEVPIFRLVNGEHQEAARLKIGDYRVIFPVGLTVESFTPFSSMCKALPEVKPILGKHPFVSLSIDDLFVLNRFLKTTGMLFHYLEVRQAVAGIPNAMMFDELDHLGAYITANRFDQTMREQLEKADMVTWDSFSEKIDRFFEQDDWSTAEPLSQNLPTEIEAILNALRTTRPLGWLSIDSLIRDYDGESRDRYAKIIRELIPTLEQHGIRRFMFFGSARPIQVWLYLDQPPTTQNVTYQGEVACLGTGQASVWALILKCQPDGLPTEASCRVVRTPPIFRNDYSALKTEAERQMKKQIDLRHKAKKRKRR